MNLSKGDNGTSEIKKKFQQTTRNGVVELRKNRDEGGRCRSCSQATEVTVKLREQVRFLKKCEENNVKSRRNTKKEAAEEARTGFKGEPRFVEKEEPEHFKVEG